MVMIQSHQEPYLLKDQPFQLNTNLRVREKELLKETIREKKKE
jgi:hypothetical protein